MNFLDRYNIAFVGLGIGDHEYNYDIDETFFHELGLTHAEKGLIKVSINLNKSTTMMVLDFRLIGNIEVECDRCTDCFELPVDYSDQVIVKFGASLAADTEDVLFLAHDDYEVNVAQFIYEFLSIAVPQRVVHPDNSAGESMCNKEMLKLIENYSPEHQSEEKTEEIDPRWEALKKLMKNDE
jgi:uncharacterized protein